MYGVSTFGSGAFSSTCGGGGEYGVFWRERLREKSVARSSCIAMVGEMFEEFARSQGTALQ